MNKNSDIKFVRIHGRIIPIRRKTVDGSAKLGAAAAIGAGAAHYAAKDIQKATFAYARSANIRGASKLATAGSKTANKLIRSSAAFKILGKGFSRRGFGVLAVGATAAGFLANEGAKDLFGEKNKAKINATAAAVTAGTLALFTRKAKISTLVKIAKVSKLSPKKSVEDLFKAYKSNGMKRTTETVRKYSGAGYKGVKPKPKDIFKASQQDLFKTKKSNIKSWLDKF